MNNQFKNNDANQASINLFFLPITVKNLLQKITPQPRIDSL